MSQGEPKPYGINHGLGVIEQIQAIKAAARLTGNLAQFKNILKKATHQLQTDPHSWGDPEFRAKTIDAVMCRGIIRPIAFRYAIYEQARGVVLLSVRLYGDFE